MKKKTPSKGLILPSKTGDGDESRCSLKRNRMQIAHYNSRSAPAAISCRSLPLLKKCSSSKTFSQEYESVFEKKIMGMEISRRHLQTVKRERKSKRE